MRRGAACAVNEPLLRYYETTAIEGLGPEYGEEPIYCAPQRHRGVAPARRAAPRRASASRRRPRVAPSYAPFDARLLSDLVGSTSTTDLVGVYAEANAVGTSFEEWMHVRPPRLRTPRSPTRLPSPSLTDHNPIRMQSWYVRERDPLAGLLTDFRFRHTPEDYPRPCLLYTSPSPRDQRGSRMPSSA